MEKFTEKEITEIKLECLRIVVSWGHKSIDATEQAEKLFNWVMKAYIQHS